MRPAVFFPLSINKIQCVYAITNFNHDNIFKISKLQPATYVTRISNSLIVFLKCYRGKEVGREIVDDLHPLNFKKRRNPEETKERKILDPRTERK